MDNGTGTHGQDPRSAVEKRPWLDRRTETYARHHAPPRMAAAMRAA